MLLRRISEHVKAQNWTAIALDFVIVVLGVFIGIQVSNWNEHRAFERREQLLLRELHGEIAQNLADAQSKGDAFLIGADSGSLDRLLVKLDDASGFGQRPPGFGFWESDDHIHIKKG